MMFRSRKRFKADSFRGTKQASGTIRRTNTIPGTGIVCVDTSENKQSAIAVWGWFVAKSYLPDPLEEVES